jgi:hypothetical protein
LVVVNAGDYATHTDYLVTLAQRGRRYATAACDLSHIELIDLIAAHRDKAHDVIYWGCRLDTATNWDEMAMLLTASYRTMAPKKLGALLHQAKP